MNQQEGGTYTPAPGEEGGTSIPLVGPAPGEEGVSLSHSIFLDDDPPLIRGFKPGLQDIKIEKFS